jgi:hypothetical protein
VVEQHRARQPQDLRWLASGHSSRGALGEAADGGDCGRRSRSDPPEDSEQGDIDLSATPPVDAGWAQVMLPRSKTLRLTLTTAKPVPRTPLFSVTQPAPHPSYKRIRAG